MTASLGFQYHRRLTTPSLSSQLLTGLLTELQLQIFEHILNDSSGRVRICEHGTHKHVSPELAMADDLAAAEVLDPEAQQAVLLVRLEHGHGGGRVVVGKARGGVDEVRPVTVVFEPGIE